MGLRSGHLPLVVLSILIVGGSSSSDRRLFRSGKVCLSLTCKSRRVWGAAARALADISGQAAHDGVTNEAWGLLRGNHFITVSCDDMFLDPSKSWAIYERSRPFGTLYMFSAWCIVQQQLALMVRGQESELISNVNPTPAWFAWSRNWLWLSIQGRVFTCGRAFLYHWQIMVQLLPLWGPVQLETSPSEDFSGAARTRGVLIFFSHTTTNPTQITLKMHHISVEMCGEKPARCLHPFQRLLPKPQHPEGLYPRAVKAGVVRA